MNLDFCAESFLTLKPENDIFLIDVSAIYELVGNVGVGILENFIVGKLCRFT